MILDLLGNFSNDQAITASAASNVVDLGSADAKVQTPFLRAEKANVFASVTTAFNNLTSLTVAIQSSTDEAFTSPVTHQSVTVARAELVVGKQFALGGLPQGVNRYVRLYYTVDGSAPSTGKVFAGFTFDKPTF